MINQNKSIFVSNKQTIVIQKLGKMSYENIDYKIIIDIFLTVTSIILMKINNGYMGIIIMLLLLYDIIEIIKNLTK